MRWARMIGGGIMMGQNDKEKWNKNIEGFLCC
jgi:hypothetical protein